MDEPKQKLPFYKRPIVWVPALLLVCFGASILAELNSAPREDDLDTRIYTVVHGVDACYTHLSDRVSEVSETEDTDNLLSTIKLLKQYQDNLDAIQTDAESNDAVLYIGSVRAYAANTRVIAESLYNYIKSGNVDDYDKFEHYLSTQTTIQLNVINKRSDYLKSKGWTSAEIEALYNA